MRIYISTIAGAISSFLVFKISALFGVASTGTAISALSGAAATSATLAYIGNSMVSGAVILVLFGAFVSAITYRRLAKKSNRLKSGGFVRLIMIHKTAQTKFRKLKWFRVSKP